MDQLVPQMPQDALDVSIHRSGVPSPQGDAVAEALRRITQIVSAELDVPISEIMSRNRTQPVADARHLAMFLAAEAFPRSIETVIAPYFDRDGSDVSHAKRKIRDRCSVDSKYCVVVRKIEVLVRPPCPAASAVPAGGPSVG